MERAIKIGELTSFFGKLYVVIDVIDLNVHFVFQRTTDDDRYRVGMDNAKYYVDNVSVLIT